MRNRVATRIRGTETVLLFTAMVTAIVTAAACSTTNHDTNEAGGEVAVLGNIDAARPTAPVKWLTDANLLSLLGVMNARQIAAADIELESWHVDSVRAFAAGVAREHAELQHSVDSVAERIRVAPIAPALAHTVATTMQAQIDTVRRASGRVLDRAFIREQVASYQFMTETLSELTAVAERPEVRSLLSAARGRASAQLNHARALHTKLAIADSAAAADSAAKVATKLAAQRARHD